jgi:intracellular septation protein
MRELAYAARPLANDLASSLLFAALLAAGVDVTAATLIAVGFGVAHVLLWAALRKPIALVLVFWTAGLFLHDPRFLMAKPSVIYLIVAVAMLKRGWMLRYMPPIARGHGEDVMVVFGYVWAGLMALSAGLNLAVAVWLPEQWPLYKAIFPIGSKLVLFAIHFATVRHVVKGRIIAKARAAAQPA